MTRSVEGLFDLIEAESRYSSWDRVSLLGAMITLFAASLCLLWLALLPLNLTFSWAFLLIPSFVLGFWGLMQYFYGKDKMTEINKEIKALIRKESILTGLGEVTIKDELTNKP